MSDREPLPTREQINAIGDICALQAIINEIDLRVAQIEAQLEFLDGDDSWVSRATNALALHRYTQRIALRRLDKLKPKPFRPTRKVERRAAEEMDELTIEVLAELPSIDVEALATTQQVDWAVDWIVMRINAVTVDRSEEVALAPIERDERFLTDTGCALKSLRATRIALQNRRAAVLRLEREVEHAARQPLQDSRERLFIDAAREVLDRATYMAVWERVDRMQKQEASHG